MCTIKLSKILIDLLSRFSLIGSLTNVKFNLIFYEINQHGLEPQWDPG